MDYTIIITAKDEPKTVGQLVRQIEDQMEEIGADYEILVVCPDEKTRKSAISQDRLGVVSWLKDEGKGKPSALNLAFEKAKGKVLILTDGDVALGERALEELVKEFYCKDNLGFVTGHPVPVNSRDKFFGFWAYFLTSAADQQREQRASNNQYLDASGYLLAVHKKLVSPMPENILVDDAWLSRQIWSQGYKIGYAPKAKVKVKFPTNFSDWITQKKRTLSGYIQLRQLQKFRLFNDHQLSGKVGMRSFRQESEGLCLALTYPKNLKEYFWMVLLIFARAYVWLAVFWERKILKKPYSGNWKRIESTK